MNSPQSTVAEGLVETNTPFDRFLGRNLPKPSFGRLDWLIVLGGYAALVLAYFLPLMTGGRIATEQGGDVTAVWLWSREYLREALRAGALPLMNPYSSAGTPFLPSQQTAVFYPANWLLALIPTVALINAQIVFHFWAGLASMHWLARRLGRSTEAATVAALVFGYSGFAIAHWWQGHLPFILEWPWTPLAILAWAAIQYRSQSGVSSPGKVLLPVLALAAILAVQFFAGQPQITYFTILLLCALQSGWILWSILGDGKQKERESPKAERPSIGALRGAAWVAASGILSIFLTAVQALPVMELFSLTIRGSAITLEELQIHSLPISQSAMLVAPWAFGDEVRVPYLASGVVIRSWHEVTCYAGAVTALLAAAALFAGGRSGGGLRWTLAATGFLSWWMALGSHGGLQETLLGILPGLSTFRAPGRFVFLLTFTLALLASGGLDAMRSAAFSSDPGRRRAFRRALVLLTATLGALVILFLAVFPDGGMSRLFRDMLWEQPLSLGKTVVTSEFYERYFKQYSASLGQAALVCATAIVLLAGLSGRRTARFAAILLPGLLAAELGRFAWAYRTAVDPASVAWSPAVREALASGGGRWRFGSDRYQTDWLQGTTAGALHVWGAEPLILKRYTDAMLVSQNLYGVMKYTPQYIPQSHSTPFTRAMGMRRLLTTANRQAPPPWGIVLREDQTVVLEDAGALPRGFTVGRSRVVPPEKAAWEVNAADFEPTNTVLLEEPPPEGFSPSQNNADGPPGEVTIDADLPERFEARVRMSRPGWFVLMDQYLPGWEAQVDGRPARIYRANAVGRAIPLETGEHRVTMTYSAPGLAAGAWISGVSWAACGAAAGWLLLRGKRRREQGDDPGPAPQDAGDTTGTVVSRE